MAPIGTEEEEIIDVITEVATEVFTVLATAVEENTPCEVGTTDGWAEEPAP